MEGPPSPQLSHGIDNTVVVDETTTPNTEEEAHHQHCSSTVSRSYHERQPNKALKCFTLCNYSPLVTFVLLTMVVAGAGRSVMVKAYFQIGFESPLLVTLLYLMGSFLCLVPFYIAVMVDKCLKYMANNRRKDNNNPVQHNFSSSALARINENGRVYCEEEKEPIEGDFDDGDRREISSRDDDTTSRPIHYVTSSNAGSHLSLISLALSNRSSRFASEISAPLEDQKIESERVVSSVSGVESEQVADSSMRSNDLLTRRSSSRVGSNHQHHWTEGSTTGLTRESEERVSQWVNRVPRWLAPVLPGVCNVFKSFLRWAALIYVSASVAEILIGGLELVFIVFAARLVRKRKVSKLRWLGVIIVCIGIVIVGCTDVLGSKEVKNNADGKSGAANQLIGIALIVGQCAVSVVQDILEEIFVQVGNFPALLLVGVEGLVGVVLGLALYYPAALVLNEDPRETWNTLTSSAGKIGFVVGLTLLFMVSAVFNILGCAATSSMTRNMWGNLRTALVWVFGLIIYYSSPGDDTIGEPWLIPDSFIILAGFGVILYGLQVYYKEKATRQSKLCGRFACFGG